MLLVLLVLAGSDSEQIVSILLTTFLMLVACLMPYCSYSHDSEQIVSKMLTTFLVRAGWLLLCRYCFPNVIVANEEIGLVRAFFFQVTGGARVVNRKWVE